MHANVSFLAVFYNLERYYMNKIYNDEDSDTESNKSLQPETYL